MEHLSSGNNQLLSGSDADSDTAEEEEPGCLERSSEQHRRAEREHGASAPATGRAMVGGVTGAKPGKKTRGRVKIKMEFIDNKLRRYTTFSKRKTGIMKKVSLRSVDVHVLCVCKTPPTVASPLSLGSVVMLKHTY